MIVMTDREKDLALQDMSMLLTSGNDHLKKLDVYNKKKQKVDRLAWI